MRTTTNNQSNIILDKHSVARVLNGDVTSEGASVPGPNHSSTDRSLSIKISPDAPDGFIVYSHAGDDPIVCRDYVRSRLGLPPFQPNRREQPKRLGSDKTKLGKVIATYDYQDRTGALLYQVVRLDPKDFRQRRPDGNGGWEWKLDDHRAIYRWPELLQYPDATVFVTEGEKDTNLLWDLGQCATTVASGKWTNECVEALAGRDCWILQDNDEAGRKKALAAAHALHGVAKSIRIILLPDLGPGEDVSDWIKTDPSRAGQLVNICADTPEWVPSAANENNPNAQSENGVTLDDFYAFMPTHSYIFAPDRSPWPASSVNSRIPPVVLRDAEGNPLLDHKGQQQVIMAAAWLDKNRPIEQMTWSPGFPELIRDRLISEGGWIKRVGMTVLNLYMPPTIELGNPNEAGPWIDHVRKVYPNEADHIIAWLAHRVQHPDQKCNHALVLGGAQGIGKDTLLEAVKHAIGPWNFHEVSPVQMLGRFNGFLKSVILRVSEARDLGDVNRYQFYDHMKAYTASPPDVLRVDEKHLREYSVFNVCGIVITTNHKSDGIYLPADDRRHYVAWSELTKDDFTPEYWTSLWEWYENGGYGHVAAYLKSLDISDFNPKAPPPKTPAFWDIVDANRAPEDSELADALDDLGNPNAVTLSDIKMLASADLRLWLDDRKNRRVIPHRLESCGYTPVRNDGAKDGQWKINGQRQTVYAKAALAMRERMRAARDLTNR